MHGLASNCGSLYAGQTNQFSGTVALTDLDVQLKSVGAAFMMFPEIISGLSVHFSEIKLP